MTNWDQGKERHGHWKELELDYSTFQKTKGIEGTGGSSRREKWRVGFGG